MTRFFRSFQARMVFSILLISALTWTLGLTAIYFVGKGVIEKSIGIKFQQSAEETSKNLSRFFDRHLKEAYTFATSPELLQFLQETNRAYDLPASPDRVDRVKAEWEEITTHSLLMKWLLQNPTARHLQAFHHKQGRSEENVGTLLLDKKGVAVAATGEPKLIHFGNEPWWKPVTSASEGGQYISDVEVASPFKNTPPIFTLSIATPIYGPEGDEVIGVLLMVQSIKAFFDLVTEVKLAETDHTMLAASNGDLVFCPIFLVKNHPLQPELIQAISSESAGWGTTRVDVHHPGRKSIQGFAPVRIPGAVEGSLGGNRWYIFTSQDPAETYAPIQTLLGWVAGLGAFGVGMLALFISYATGKLVRPIEQLQMGAKEIARGRFQKRLDIRTEDEIEALASAFNEMATKIEASHAQLEQKVAQRTQDLEARNRELSALYTISSTLGKSLHLKELMDEALSTVLTIFHTEAGMIHLLEGAEGLLTLTSGRGFSIEEIDPNRKKKDAEILYRHVIEKDSPFSSIDDPGGEAPFQAAPFTHFISLPIQSKGKILGTLTLLDHTAEPFLRGDRELLVTIANQIGVAIENIRLYEETKKVDQLKSDFVSKVSHEFRTPLTSIKGFTEILLSYDDISHEKKVEFLQIINRESDRLSRLINDILDLSKIEAGKIAWKIEPTDLSELIHSTAKATLPLINPQKVTLGVEIEQDLPLVRGDRDHLIQILNNLFSNAIKFTEKGEIIAFARRSTDKEVVAGVRDTGIGLPENETGKIFNRFYQFSRPEKGMPKGTGLGLAICQEIIHHLKGKIWCESEPGKGSAFYFTLPISDAPPEAEDLKVTTHGKDRENR